MVLLTASRIPMAFAAACRQVRRGVQFFDTGKRVASIGKEAHESNAAELATVDGVVRDHSACPDVAVE